MPTQRLLLGRVLGLVRVQACTAQLMLVLVLIRCMPCQLRRRQIQPTLGTQLQVLVMLPTSSTRVLHKEVPVMSWWQDQRGQRLLRGGTGNHSGAPVRLQTEARARQWL